MRFLPEQIINEISEIKKISGSYSIKYNMSKFINQ